MRPQGLHLRAGRLGQTDGRIGNTIRRGQRFKGHSIAGQANKGRMFQFRSGKVHGSIGLDRIGHELTRR